MSAKLRLGEAAAQPFGKACMVQRVGNGREPEGSAECEVAIGPAPIVYAFLPLDPVPRNAGRNEVRPSR
jgi:hypothetical protein